MIVVERADDSDKALDARLRYWQEAAAELPVLEDNRPVAVHTLRRGLASYAELARDVALARRKAPRSRVTAYLESLYAGLHRAIYRPPVKRWQDVTRVFTRDVPRVARQLRWQIASITLGFVLSALAGWWLVATYPELVALFASQAMIDTVQRGELWTDGLLNTMPASMLAAGIFTNNIVVALTAMSLGVFYGLGTLYIVALNGLMLGGVFAFTAQYGLADRLFQFVAAHGPVELSVIFIAAAVGFSLGEALARPGHRSRLAAFQLAVRDGTKLMLLCVVFLVGAGIIEGYISPDERYPLAVRLLVGWGYWLVLLLALNGWRLPRWPGGAAATGGAAASAGDTDRRPGPAGL